MAYEKTQWAAREGTGLNKFTKSQETDTTVYLENTPDSVTEPGMVFSVNAMNHIEQGIYDAHEAVAAVLAASVRRNEIGAAGGVASLDDDGKVPVSQLPALDGGNAEDSHADMVDGAGRDLRLVFGIDSLDPAVYIPLIMAELRRRCNNNGEIDNTGIPDFRGILIGDYIDGLDLSGIAAAPANNAPQAWNDTYKNNRIVVSGFNIYKGFGTFYILQCDLPGTNEGFQR